MTGHRCGTVGLGTLPAVLDPLARKWRDGLFGDLMYAEYEYVHECRSLVYTYIDRLPVQPGYTLHNWRSWLNFHYYNTHSLGPVMHITGTRPTRVVALPGAQTLASYPMRAPVAMGGITPSPLVSYPITSRSSMSGMPKSPRFRIKKSTAVCFALRGMTVPVSALP